MPNMKVTIDAMNEVGMRDIVRIMVGGTPVTADYANQIGADGYAPDASPAASMAKSFVQ